MKKILLIITAIAFPYFANASTKYIECILNHGVHDGIYILDVILDDSSKSAEVLLYAPDSSCGKEKTCPTAIYKKELFPTFIRLTYKTTYLNQIVDINRKSLDSVTKFHAGEAEIIYKGKCDIVKTEYFKNLL